jgi:hypothetical protein
MKQSQKLSKQKLGPQTPTCIFYLSRQYEGWLRLSLNTPALGLKFPGVAEHNNKTTELEFLTEKAANNLTKLTGLPVFGMVFMVRA